MKRTSYHISSIKNLRKTSVFQFGTGAIRSHRYDFDYGGVNRSNA